MKAAVETVHGQYHLAIMPDGAEVMMEKLSNGDWVPVKTRLEEDKTWADTATVPAPHEPRTEGALTLDQEKLLVNATRTRDHCQAYLVEVFGHRPMHELYTGELPKLLPGIKRHVLGLIKTLNMPSWNRVGARLEE